MVNNSRLRAGPKLAVRIGHLKGVVEGEAQGESGTGEENQGSTFTVTKAEAVGSFRRSM